MIYFLDNSLQLQKIVTSKNINSAVHEHELNGLIRGDVELDLSYANKFLVLGIDHVGYYYKDDFYLHKIQRVEYDHVNETVLVVLRHVFFEDMLFGPLIKDVRPQNQDALFVLNQTIDTNTRWQTVMTDVTGRLSTNFYWQVPYEVIEFVTENYRVEYIPKILFDGQKINGFQLHVANKVGKDKNIRIPFGSRVLDLKYEVDYSEIITKLVGHGKGEEVGDGYGRRINIADVNFSKNGVESPLGDVYMEDETVTVTYGNDGQAPREGRVIFEDIENVNELAQATYEHYLQVSRPQMLFTADVADIGDVGIGDSLMIIRREYDVYFKARIHKLTVDLLYPEDAQVELGDYEHFKESKISRKSREKNNRLHKRNQSLIEQAKRDFDERFNSAVEQFRSEFEQAKIDIFAEIEADRERMENEWQEQWNTGMSEIQNGIKEAERKATENANRIENDIKSDLDQLTKNHGSILDELKENVMNIDEFLGTSRSITLDQRFLDISQNFEERLRKVDSNTFNMIRGTRFDEPDMFHLYSGAELQEEGDVKFVTLYSERFNEPRVHFAESVTLEKGKKYIVAVDYRSYGAKELDRLAIGDMDGYYNLIDDIDKPLSDLHTDGKWRRTYGTVIPSETVSGEFQIGTNFISGDDTRERIDIKLVYLTGSNNTDWVYHPQDATQSIEEVTRRITNLEDGYSEFVTKSLYDAETDTLNQYIKSVEETAEGNQMTLQRVEDWQATNGQSVLETVDAYERKLWLNDVSEIGANLIPYSQDAWEVGRYWSGGTGNLLPNNIRTRREHSIWVSTGVAYTFSDDSPENSNIDYWLINFTDQDRENSYGNQLTVRRGESRTFTTPSNHILLTAIAVSGAEVRIARLTGPNRRIFTKLEKGSVATPTLNAISHIEQLANQVSIQVQELDGTFLKQTDFKLTPDYWQLGAMRIGAEDVSSVLRGSPDAIDAVVSEFNLTGNLNAKGHITSLAVDAIEGNFARLFTARLNANVITTDHISGLSAEFQRMYILNANIERLVAQNIFTQNVKSLSIEAVEGQFSSLMTKYFSANYIDVNYINGKNAWFESQYTLNANIAKLTAQHAFIRDVQAIEITANQLNIQTLHSKLKGVEGGLTIYGYDGRVLINNSILENTFSIGFIQPRFMGVGVELSANYFKTTNTSYTTAAAFSFLRGGRYLTIEGYCEMRGEVSGSADTTVGAIRLMEYSSGSRSAFTMIESRKTNNNDNQFFRIRLDLGVPQYEQRNFYVQFYTAHPGNGAYFRINQAYYHG